MKLNKFLEFVLKIITIVLMVLLAIVLIIVVAKVIKANEFDSEKYEIVEYTVNRGDTIWSIGEQHKIPSEDVRRWIFEVEKLNEKDLDIIQPRQVIYIYSAIEGGEN